MRETLMKVFLYLFGSDEENNWRKHVKPAENLFQNKKKTPPKLKENKI